MFGRKQARRALRTALLVSLLIGWAFSAQTFAAVCEFPPDMRTPPVGVEDGTTPLEVGIYLLDLIRVEDAAQGFVADVFVRVSWRDPRLSNKSGTTCIVPSSEIWTPRAEIVNQRDLKAKWPERVRIAPDGTALYRQRYYGTFSFHIDLAEFPFDRQKIPIEMILGEAGEAVTVQVDRLTGRTESLSIPNWILGTADAKVDAYEVSAANIRLPMFVVEFQAERRSVFYVFQIIVPLVLIVCMSWAVFWIHPRHIPPRLGLASTGMLTLIAFRLALGASLPPVSYLTRLDRFVIGATIIVFAALAQAVATAALADSDRVIEAERINRGSRVIFPLGLAVSALIAFL